MFKIILFILLIGVLILAVLAFYVIIKPYTEVVDCIGLYTGGNGSGKSFFSCHRAVVLLRKNRIKVFFKNIINAILKKPRIPKPIMLSSIPVRISLREWSTPLTVNPFVMQERFPEKCVVFIDEVNLFLSQMDFRFESEEQVNTSVTLFRHLTKNGFLILNTQNVNKCNYIFRYCANRSYNLCEFRKPILGLPILAWVKCRHVSIGDDIKSVEEIDVNEGRRNLFAFFPRFGIRSLSWYDTHAYSNITNDLPIVKRDPYKSYKRNSFMHLDVKRKYEKKIDCSVDEFDSGGVGSECVKPPDRTVIKKYCKKDK